MKFIVKIKYKTTEAVSYWLGANQGTTPSKAEAYRYTVDELKKHRCKSELQPRKTGKRKYGAVLIPVED